jgi:hypothetical protein
VLLENISDQPISVVFDWAAPTCGGSTHHWAPLERSFLHSLHSQLGIASTLKPGEWDALVFPLALETEEARPRESPA